MTTTNRVTWNEIRQLADELRLDMHLAGMELKTRWEDLQPQLAEFETRIEARAAQAAEAINSEFSSLAIALRRLREDLGRA